MVFYDTGGSPIVIIRKRFIDPTLDVMLERGGTQCDGGEASVEEIRGEVGNKLSGDAWDVEVLSTEIVLPRTTDRYKVSDALSKL